MMMMMMMMMINVAGTISLKMQKSKFKQETLSAFRSNSYRAAALAKLPGRHPRQVNHRPNIATRLTWKTRMHGSQRYDMLIFNRRRFDTMPPCDRRTADRRTDRLQIPCHSIVRVIGLHKRRAVKKILNQTKPNGVLKQKRDFWSKNVFFACSSFIHPCSAVTVV